jgi:multidrug efflux pump subunit AcrA (membrane-fusion protein)
VFVVAGAVARKRDVRIGTEANGKVEIADGLKAGEQVALDGAAALEDGMAVRLK